MNLVLVEEAAQAPCVKKKFGEDYLYLAMTPGAMYALEKEKLEFRIPEDYYDNEKLQKEWPAYFDLSSFIISKVDDWALESLPGHLPHFSVRPLEANAQMFFNMFRQVVIAVFTLQKVFEKENPMKVAFPETDTDRLSYRLYFEFESLNSRLIPLLADNRFQFSSYSWPRDTGLAAKSPVNRLSLRGLVRNRINKFLRKSRQGKGPALLVFHEGYDLEFVLPELRRRGISIIYFEDIAPDERTLGRAGYFDLLFGNNPALIDLFEYNKVNFFQVVKPRLQYYLDNVFAGWSGTFDYFRRAIKSHNIAALVSGHSPSRVFENILCAAAKAEGAKIISFQHGGYGERFNHMLHVNDFDNPLSDYFLVWGRGVVDYARKYSLNRVKNVPVGSAWIDSLVNKAKTCSGRRERHGSVLYLPTSLRVRPKCRMLPGEYPDNSYYLLQKKIISTVCAVPGIDFSVRLHPSDREQNPIADFMRTAGLCNCRSVSGNLTEHLLEAGLVISDFMSTTLIQALGMGKKIMFYIDQSSMLLEPRARELLEKCSYCYDDVGEFLGAIADYARDDSKFPRKDDREFLLNYGTYIGDGKSAYRAAGVIENIMSGVL